MERCPDANAAHRPLGRCPRRGPGPLDRQDPDSELSPVALRDHAPLGSSAASSRADRLGTVQSGLCRCQCMAGRPLLCHGTLHGAGGALPGLDVDACKSHRRQWTIWPSRIGPLVPLALDVSNQRQTSDDRRRLLCEVQLCSTALSVPVDEVRAPPRVDEPCANTRWSRAGMHLAQRVALWRPGMEISYCSRTCR